MAAELKRLGCGTVTRIFAFSAENSLTLPAAINGLTGGCWIRAVETITAASAALWRFLVTFFAASTAYNELLAKMNINRSYIKGLAFETARSGT